MSMSSVNTSPPKPSSPRSVPVTIRWDSVAGRCSSSEGTSRWPVMMAATPAAIAARNGTKSTACKRSGGLSTRGSSRWESTPVSPCPGKCLPHAARPALCSPWMIATPIRATTSARWLSARSPIAGFVGLVRTSSTGAKSIEKPTARSSAANAAANLAASFSSPDRPSASIGGHSVSGCLSLATRPPS